MAATQAPQIGFQGGQVLALRVAEEQLRALDKALGGGGWHELESEEGRCASTSARSSTCAPKREPRVGFGSRRRRSALRIAELAAAPRARAGTPPRAERAVARFSRLGEHGGVWLAIGARRLGARPPRARRAGAGRPATVAGAYVLNTALKLAVRRRRPQLPGLPR